MKVKKRMKLLLKLIFPSKAKEPKEEICKHDWATVKTYDPIELLANYQGFASVNVGASVTSLGAVDCISKDTRIVWGSFRKEVDILRFKWNSPEGIVIESNQFYIDDVHTRSSRVCLLCGECYDVKRVFAKEIKKKIDDRIAEMKLTADRKELAAKMWEEGCKNG